MDAAWVDAAWKLAIGTAAGLAAGWLALVVVLLLQSRRYERPSLREMLRLLPNLVRLLNRLAADDALPRRMRVTLWLLLGYLAMPVDLIPDFLPVIGYADDAIIVAWVLRSVARQAGVDALRQHWPGTPEGLTAVLRAVGVRELNQSD